MIVKPGTFRLKRSLNNQVARIFANGQDGFWYDPLLPYLTKISDGTQPVTAAEDPIGRWIDRSGRNNHGIQATDPARPTYRVDAAGRPYAAFLGTDDSLTSATGGGGSAGFLYIIAMKLTGGAATARFQYADNGTNTGYTVRVTAGNLFSLDAGNGSAYTRVSWATQLNVGDIVVATARDDGTNLMVRINGGEWVTAPRPAVVAGSAGFTLGKDHNAAANYNIADVYFQAYAKNTGLTLAQVASIEKLAASRIGISI